MRYWFVDDDDLEEPAVQYLLSRTAWDVYDTRRYWGRIEWDGAQILMSGPDKPAMMRMLDDMGRDMTPELLFRSLPFRLNGYIHLEEPV